MVAYPAARRTACRADQDTRGASSLHLSIRGDACASGTGSVSGVSYLAARADLLLDDVQRLWPGASLDAACSLRSRDRVRPLLTRESRSGHLGKPECSRACEAEIS